jgi:hypothetical protein
MLQMLSSAAGPGGTPLEIVDCAWRATRGQRAADTL